MFEQFRSGEISSVAHVFTVHQSKMGAGVANINAKSFHVLKS
jgi:hypothetical protein